MVQEVCQICYGSRTGQTAAVCLTKVPHFGFPRAPSNFSSHMVILTMFPLTRNNLNRRRRLRADRISGAIICVCLKLQDNPCDREKNQEKDSKCTAREEARYIILRGLLNHISSKPYACDRAFGAVA